MDRKLQTLIIVRAGRLAAMNAVLAEAQAEAAAARALAATVPEPAVEEEQDAGGGGGLIGWVRGLFGAKL
jgi:hypothetical protein